MKKYKFSFRTLKNSWLDLGEKLATIAMTLLVIQIIVSHLEIGFFQSLSWWNIYNVFVILAEHKI